MDGSISIQVSLDIDKSELENLEKSKLKKTVELEIDGKSLDKIEDRKLTFMGYLDSSAIEKELERLEQRGLSFKGSGGGGGGGFDCCDDIVNAISELKNTLSSILITNENKLTQAISLNARDQVKNNRDIDNAQRRTQAGRDFTGFVTAPLRSIIRGTFEGFGQGVSKSFAAQTVLSLEEKLGVSFKKYGEFFGEILAKQIDNAFEISNRKSPSERVIVTPPPNKTGESEGNVNPQPKPKAPTGGSGKGVTPEATRASVDDIAKSRQFFQKSNREIGKAKSVVNRKEFNKPVTDKEIEETLETLRKGKLYARKVSNWIDETIKQIDNELAAMPRQKRIGSEQAMLKAQLIRTKSSIKDFERLQNQASKVGLGQAVSDGVAKGVDRKKAYKAGQDVGKSTAKGFTDETGIASPSKKFMGYGRNLIDGLIKGIIDKTPFACQAVKHTGKLLEKTIRDSFVTFGDNIFDGLSQGISAYIGDKGVGKIGKLIGTSLLSSVKKVLGIQSPSKEFKAVGKDVIQGFLIGLKGLEAPLATKVRIILNYIKLIKLATNSFGQYDRPQSLGELSIPKLKLFEGGENGSAYYDGNEHNIHAKSSDVLKLKDRKFLNPTKPFNKTNNNIDEDFINNDITNKITHEWMHHLQNVSRFSGMGQKRALLSGTKIKRVSISNPLVAGLPKSKASLGENQLGTIYSTLSAMEKYETELKNISSSPKFDSKEGQHFVKKFSKIKEYLKKSIYQNESEAYSFGQTLMVYVHLYHQLFSELDTQLKINLRSLKTAYKVGQKNNKITTIDVSAVRVTPQLEAGMGGGNKPPKPPQLLLPPASPDPNKLPKLPPLTQSEILKRFGRKATVLPPPLPDLKFRYPLDNILEDFNPLPKLPPLSQKEILNKFRNKPLPQLPLLTQSEILKRFGRKTTVLPPPLPDLKFRYPSSPLPENINPRNIDPNWQFHEPKFSMPKWPFASRQGAAKEYPTNKQARQSVKEVEQKIYETQKTINQTIDNLKNIAEKAQKVEVHVDEKVKRMGKNLNKNAPKVAEKIFEGAISFARFGFRAFNYINESVEGKKRTVPKRNEDSRHIPFLRRIGLSTPEESLGEIGGRSRGDGEDAERFHLQNRAFKRRAKNVAIKADKAIKEAYESIFSSPIESVQTILKNIRIKKSVDKSIKHFERQESDSLEVKFERFFQGIYAQFRRKSLKGMSGKEKDQAIQEGAGFMVAAATMIAPLSVLKTLFLPLAAAISPLLITFAGLNNVLQPLVMRIAETIKFIEPIQRRFEINAGSKEGGRKELEYLQSVAEDYKVPLQGALEQYSRFTLAVKNTPLEGKKARDFYESLVIAIKGIGFSSEESSRIFLAFNQIIQKGKLSAEEVRQQLAETGFPIIEFARALNVGLPEFNALLEKGALTASEVLPKLGKQIKKDFGDAAKEATGSFTSGLIGVENALFRLQKDIGDTFGGVFALVSNSMANTINFFVGKLRLLTQLALTTIIGFGAQVLVGSQTILFGSKITKFIQAGQLFATQAVVTAIASITPFLFGIIADVLDDVFGAKRSVFQNLTDFFKNIIIEIVYGFDSLIKSPIGDFIKNIINGFIGMGKAILWLTSKINSGVIELIAMIFILIQVSALMKLYVVPAILQFSAALSRLVLATVAAIASGEGLSKIWLTMTGGIGRAGLLLAGLLGVLVLMVAKSDVLNELWLPLKQANGELNSSLLGIITTLEILERQGKKSADSLKFNVLPSKGFELNPFSLVGAESFKTDDYRKFIRGISSKDIFGKDIQRKKDPKFEKQLKDLGIDKYINTDSLSTVTTAEKYLIENAQTIKEYNNNINQYLKRANLTSDSKNPLNDEALTVKNKALEIDRQLLMLQEKRAKYGLINTSKSKQAMGEIDRQILKLQEERRIVIKPVLDIVNYVQDSLQIAKDIKQNIDNQKLPAPVKRALLDQLKPTLDQLESANKILTDSGYVASINELETAWKDITNSIDDASKAYEKFLRLSQINLLNRQTDITNQRFTPEEEAKQLGELELRDLQNKESNLASILDLQTASRAKLLKIPNPSEEQNKQLDELKTSIEQKELELAQTRLNIAQKTAEQRKKIEADMLADLTRANKQAIAVIEQSTGSRVIKALEGQKSNKLSPQSADYLMGQAQSDSVIESSKQNLRELEQETLEYKKMRAMSEEDYQKNIGKVLSDKEIAMYAKKTDEKMLTEQEFVDKSIEVNKKLLETKQALLREELKARQAARDEEIRQANELAIANKKTLGEKLQGNPINLGQIETALILEDIVAIEKSIMVIGKSDPVKLRELNKQLNELENRLIAVLEAQKIARLDAEKIQQTKLSVSAKRVGLDADAALIAAKAEKKYSDELIKVKKESLAEYERLNLSGALNDSQYAEKRRQLLGELRQTEQQNIEALINLEKARIDALMNNLERELKYRNDLQDLRNKELEDVKRLKEATNDLSKASSDLRISGNEGKISLIDKALEGFGESGQKAKERFDKAQGIKYQERVRSLLGVPLDPTSLLEERSRLERKIAAEKFDALQREMTLQREMLQLEQEQAITAKQRAIEEAEINKIKAEQLLLIARKAVLEAKSPEDKAIADKGLEIAVKGLEIAGKQVATAQRGLQTEVEISNKKRESLQVTQTQQTRELGLGEILKNPGSLPGFKMGTYAPALPLIPEDEFNLSKPRQQKPIPQTIDDLNTIYAPKITNFDDLNNTYKPKINNFDDLNNTYKPKVNDLNNTYKKHPIPSFRESGMMVNYRPSYDEITPKYMPSVNQTPQFDMNAILRSQEQILTKMMQRPTIDKVEVNNSFGDANTQKTFDEYRTQTLRDFNDVLEKKAGF